MADEDVLRTTVAQELGHLDPQSPDPQLVVRLGSDGLILYRRGESARSVEDLALAAKVWKQLGALGAPPSVRLTYLLNRVGTLNILFETTEAPSDLSELVEALRDLVAADALDHARQIMAKVELGRRLIHGFRLLGAGALPNLDQGIDLLGGVLGSLPVGSPEAISSANDVGWAVQKRLDILNPSPDYPRLAAALSGAIAATDPASERWWLLRLWLGAVQVEHHRRTGSLEALDRIIEALEPAAAPACPPHLRASVEVLLGSTLVIRYQIGHRPDFADLKAAQAHLDLALELVPATPEEHAEALSARASVEEELYKFSAHFGWGPITSLRRRAVKVAEGTLELEKHLRVLADDLCLQYSRSHDKTDLQAALEIVERALRLPSATAQPSAMLLHRKAEIHRERYRVAAEPEDLSKAIEAYRKSANIAVIFGPALAPMIAAEWGVWAAQRAAWPEAAEAYELALSTLERLFDAEPAQPGREAWLRGVGRLAVETAAVFVRVGEVGSGALALERGRAVVTSQILATTRAQVETVSHSDSSLAARYQMAADHWLRETGAMRFLGRETHAGQIDFNVVHIGSLEGLGKGLPALASNSLVDVGRLPDSRARFSGERPDAVRSARSELDDAIAAIQAAGYPDFMRPPALRDVQAAANESPLAYVAAGNAGGIGLIVAPGQKERFIGLPELTHAALSKRAETFMEASQMLVTGLPSWNDVLDDVCRWLWDAVMDKLLGALAPAEQVTLIPAGQLGVLPMHAAWAPDDRRPTGRLYAIDRMAIAYAPNARVLRAAQATAERSLGTSVVAVDDPRAKGTPATLLHSSAEVNAVSSHFERSEILRAEEATVNSVTRAMRRNTVHHFSCHGQAQIYAPLESALDLADGPLTLKHIISLRIPSARLAVLSACETAIAGAEYPDEVVGLPAGLLEAGLGGVVGSLWRVEGLVTALLMARFYDCWLVRGQQPVAALRDAQIWVRDSNNGELATFLDPEARSSPGTEALWRRVVLLPPGERSGSHPSAWAGFSLVGC